jgi:dTDP-4-dehydrorhamnose 3,5-epimerase-like enzyme
MIDEVRVEPAKFVVTKDHSGSENGFLVELFKGGDGDRLTEVYLSAAKPGAFKGYHLHRVRSARYVCLKGRMRIILYQRKGEKWVREEHVLSESEPKRLFIPKNVATGLENIGDTEGWLVNYPDPPYDPDLKDEQVEYTQEELESGVLK